MKATYTAKGADRVQTGELHWLNVEVDGKDQQGRAPSTVCTIEIANADGRPNLAARFFVSAGIDGRGKPFVSVTALRSNSDTTKRVAASWLDFRARREERIGGGA